METWDDKVLLIPSSSILPLIAWGGWTVARGSKPGLRAPASLPSSCGRKAPGSRQMWGGGCFPPQGSSREVIAKAGGIWAGGSPELGVRWGRRRSPVVGWPPVPLKLGGGESETRPRRLFFWSGGSGGSDRSLDAGSSQRVRGSWAGWGGCE